MTDDDTQKTDDTAVAEPATEPTQVTDDATDELDAAKREALLALAPLLSNLPDISPERKFEICINAIRFTDDKDLVKPALEAAQSIKESGAKAEALVELVNEINYLKQA